MGQFRIEIVAVGGHGCERKARVGDRVYGCRRMDCPDCMFAEFVERLRRNGAGSILDSATFTHWPGQPNEVVDTLCLNDRGHAEVTRSKGDFT